MLPGGRGLCPGGCTPRGGGCATCLGEGREGELHEASGEEKENKFLLPSAVLDRLSAPSALSASAFQPPPAEWRQGGVGAAGSPRLPPCHLLIV